MTSRDNPGDKSRCNTLWRRRLNSDTEFQQGLSPMDQKHSALGIAAFIIAVVAGILMFLAIVVAGVMEAATPGGIHEHSAGAVLLGVFIIALWLLDVVAIGLGIAGLVQKDRKKVFPVLGVVFGAATILGTVALAVIGNMA